MQIGTIKGIAIKVHYSTIIIVGLVGFYAGFFYLSIVPTASIVDAVILGLINGIIILFSILAHELTHSLFAMRYGIRVSEIELYIFGGVSKIEDEPKTPKEEAVIAFVGPLSSIIIGAAFLGGYLFIPSTLSSILTVTCLYSGITNVGLGLFNLIPAFPMDGGRLLRAILWSRTKDMMTATKTASKIGRVFGYGFMIFGVFEIFFLGTLTGFWLILIGIFLNSSARSSYTDMMSQMTLSRIHVKEMINHGELTIPFEMTISDAIRRYFVPYNKEYFPVTRAGTVVGILDANDIKKMSVEERALTIAGYKMRKIADFPTVNEGETGKEVMIAMSNIHNEPHIVVVREKSDNELLGFIGEEEVVSSMRFWQKAGQAA